MLAYFTNLVFDSNFINTENFNQIADQLQTMVIVGLELNLDKSGLPEMFKPFLPKGCYFLTLNVPNCGLLEKAVISLHNYFSCLNP